MQSHPWLKLLRDFGNQTVEGVIIREIGTHCAPA
jgi:hypothetical protein